VRAANEKMRAAGGAQTGFRYVDGRQPPDVVRGVCYQVSRQRWLLCGYGNAVRRYQRFMLAAGAWWQ